MSFDPKDFRYYFDPDDNVLRGWEAIRTYLKQPSVRHVQRLEEQLGFPLGRMFDNELTPFTTMQAVDEWLFLVSAAQAEAGLGKKLLATHEQELLRRRRKKAEKQLKLI